MDIRTPRKLEAWAGHFCAGNIFQAQAIFSIRNKNSGEDQRYASTMSNVYCLIGTIIANGVEKNRLYELATIKNFPK